MLLLACIAALLQFETGVAYRFSAKDDPGNPVAWAACLGRNMDDSRDAIIAHRTLPCGSKVLLYAPESDKWAVATVGDRGPWGRSKKTGRYRGVVDLSPIVDARLNTRGRGSVLIIPLKGSFVDVQDAALPLYSQANRRRRMPLWMRPRQ